MDFIKEKSGSTIALLKETLTDLPETIKSAADELLGEDVDRYADSAFADMYNREFPIFSKEATLWSYLYSLVEKPQTKQACIRLNGAVNSYGLRSEADKYAAIFNEKQKQAADKQIEYALIVSDGDTIHTYYPIDNSLHVEESAKQAANDYYDGRISRELFVDASRELFKAAEAFDIQYMLPRSVVSVGEERLGDRDALLDLLQKRAELTKEEGYTSIAEALPEDPDQEHFKQAADLTSRLDEIYDLGVDAPDVYTTTFRGLRIDELRKQAARSFMVDDLVLPVSALRTETFNEDLDVWCPDHAKDIIKKAVNEDDGALVDTMVNSLPEENRTILIRLLASSHTE
jgi:hypothetical protein